VRALILESEILRGATIEELSKTDRGRQIIWPLLERQTIFQNNLSAGEYWYPAVDGFPIPTKGILVKKIPERVTSIVLATDGYPMLGRNLRESENALKELLGRDPLLFREYKNSKGVLSGNVSFDDRAFVRLRHRR
jgi:glycerophosphoryl diester phosphodiesterase